MFYGMNVSEPAQYASIGQAVDDATKDVRSGRKPISAFNDAVKSWKAQGGDAAARLLRGHPHQVRHRSVAGRRDSTAVNDPGRLHTCRGRPRKDPRNLDHESGHPRVPSRPEHLPGRRRLLPGLLQLRVLPRRADLPQPRPGATGRRSATSWTGRASCTCRPAPPARPAASTRPTLRHHDGRFWMITTNVNDRRQPAGHRHRPGRPLVRADPGCPASTASTPTWPGTTTTAGAPSPASRRSASTRTPERPSADAAAAPGRARRAPRPRKRRTSTGSATTGTCSSPRAAPSAGTASRSPAARRPPARSSRARPTRS